MYVTQGSSREASESKFLIQIEQEAGARGRIRDRADKIAFIWWKQQGQMCLLAAVLTLPNLHAYYVHPRPYSIGKIFEAAVHREQIKLNTGKVTSSCCWFCLI